MTDEPTQQLRPPAPIKPEREARRFVVELAVSRQEFEVHEGESILEILLEAGFDIPFACEQGICGSCETRVVSGIPEHRDSILTEDERAENKVVMLCCAGSVSDRLVLDL